MKKRRIRLIAAAIALICITLLSQYVYFRFVKKDDPVQDISIPENAERVEVVWVSDGDTYIVKKGDTLYSIARRYNMSVDNLKTLNNLTSNEIQIGQVLKVSNKDQLNKDVIVYIVQRGDSLYKISKMFGTTIESIKRLNNLSSDIITPGQELVINENIPVGENNYYVVKKGDTLYGIAKNNNITVDELIKTNNLSSLILKVGDKLIVP